MSGGINQFIDQMRLYEPGVTIASTLESSTISVTGLVFRVLDFG
jgi:hypothetical protein